MRKSAPPLLAIFRSRVQAEILASVYLRHTQAPISIADLAREIGAPSATTHREVSRLVDSGLLDERRLGRARIVRAPGPEVPYVRPLTDLLALTFGPLPVLDELLAEVEGVDRAYLYGSWAARYDGEPGPTPNDVDVIVVGGADLDDLDRAAEAASTRLHREVTVRRVTPQTWEAVDSDPFIATVRSRPVVELPLLRGEAS